MMARYRKTILWYFVTDGQIVDPMNNPVPLGIKKTCDALMLARDNGDVKAAREILDRVGGRPMTQIDLNVNNVKMIADDTPRIAPGPDAIHVEARTIPQNLTSGQE
jgi:hypothetical protein